MAIQQIDVYVKDGCNLCDDMITQLCSLQILWRERLPFSMNVLEIEDSPDWYEKYREYVPVIVVNHEEICHYFLDKDELEQALR